MSWGESQGTLTSDGLKNQFQLFLLTGLGVTQIAGICSEI